MIYTYQETSESGSFSCPNGADVSYANSKADLAWALDSWRGQYNRVGSDPDYASITVWKGRLADVQDLYPDFIVLAGPRGGARFQPC